MSEDTVGTRNNSRYITKTVKSAGESLILWGYNESYKNLWNGEKYHFTNTPPIIRYSRWNSQTWWSILSYTACNKQVPHGWIQYYDVDLSKALNIIEPMVSYYLQVPQLMKVLKMSYWNNFEFVFFFYPSKFRL